MRRSTSPVGPLMVIAFVGAGFGPVFAQNTVQGKASQIEVIVPGELRGPVDVNSPWQFLNTPDPTIQAEELAPPQPTVAKGDPAEKPLTDEERARLAEALLMGPQELGTASSKKVRQRGTSVRSSNALEVTRNQQSNGLSTVVFNKAIAPDAGDWKAKVGADLGTADSNNGYTNNPIRTQRDARSANAAWASVDVRDFATVDARVNPASEQGVVATTFKQSMPIGSHLSMTLQSRTSVTETFGRGSTASQFDIPMAALPATDSAAAQRVWGQENSARLKVLATGTTFGAGVSANSTDTVTHNILTAEQQLYGPLSVSTSIHDAGQTGESRSVSARAKFKW